MNLNESIRYQILQAVTKNHFDKPKELLDKEREKLHLRVYTHCFGEKTVRRMKALPVGWLREVTWLYLRDGIRNERHELKFKSKPVRVPYDDGREELKLHDSALSAELHALREKQDLLKEQERVAFDQAKAVLGSCRTVEKLLKVWPEVKKFIPKDCASVTTALTIPISNLNQMLGLK